MLALGMCASVSIFAFVDATLVKPLPYEQPSRLVAAYERVALFPRSNLSYADYLDWKRQNTVFTSLDVYDSTMFMLRGQSGSEPARGARVSDGFFRTLGVRPIHGRDFRTGEDLPSGPRVVLLSYSAWQNRYGGRPDAVGRTVSLNGQPYVIIGVLARDFHFAPAEPADFWAALHPESECDLRRSCHSLYGVARLKDGVSIDTATANVVAIAAGLEKVYPDSNRGQGASLVPLTEVISGDMRPLLLVLLGGAALLLVIAGVNVASLLLVRSESRARELAVRTALGASTGRLLRQFVAESLVLASLGSVLGICRGLRRDAAAHDAHPRRHAGVDVVPPGPRPQRARPRLRSSHRRARRDPLCAHAGAPRPLDRAAGCPVRGQPRSRGHAVATPGFQAGGRRACAGGRPARRAGLLARSLYLVLRVDPGLRPDHLVVLQVAAPAESYGSRSRRSRSRAGDRAHRRAAGRFVGRRDEHPTHQRVG